MPIGRQKLNKQELDKWARLNMNRGPSCQECKKEFTESLLCCCDSGFYYETSGKIVYINGFCEECCVHPKQKRS